ncbi:Actin-related protein 2/3 complex subunit 1 [Diplonema papillatum]|nr:Actin-related protein 2/3 complex subunit 1 [Diplonema papillatum]
MSLKKKDATRSLTMMSIKCHAYNKDRSLVAVSNSSPDVLIYEVIGTDCSSWKLVDTLKSHDMTVLGIDWGVNTDRILSCSEDRTAYVWEKQKDGTWKPHLVVLGPGCTFAGLTCKWGEKEEKFVVATGSGSSYICYYEESNDWWLSKGAKGHTSSVTCVAWMPGCDDLILATGSTDSKLKIISAYVKPADGKVDNPGKQGTVLGEHNMGGWVTGIDFSADGDWLAVVAHDSSISFVDTSEGEYDKIETMRLKLLPFTSVCFVNDTTCIAGGYSFYPVCFQVEDGKWSLVGKWVEGGKQDEEKKTSTASKAMAMFQEQAKFGESQQKKVALTKHTGTITQVRVIKYGKAYSFSTCGADGQVNIWKAADMVAA